MLISFMNIHEIFVKKTSLVKMCVKRNFFFFLRELILGSKFLLLIFDNFLRQNWVKFVIIKKIFLFTMCLSQKM